MTKSKPRFFGTALIGGLNLFSLILMTGKLLNMILKASVTFNDWSFAATMLVFFVFTLDILMQDTQIVTIDDGEILYKNWLTGNTKSYRFDQLDGFVTQNQGGHSGEYEVIFLTKGNKRFGKISSFYYSNYLDLKEGLQNLKHLGLEPFDLLKSLKRRLTE